MRVLCIFGPTASGKSALALALAQRLDATVINADSMQVYADLRVLTARPTQEEEAQAPHALYGFIDAAERFSVGRWLRAARAVLAALAGRQAIFVGGTGLYFKALTEGLVELPEIDLEARNALLAELERLETSALHALLAELDPPLAARLPPNDRVRILRGIEVARTAGARLSELVADTRPTIAEGGWIGVALTPPRASLVAAIHARAEAMFAGGALEEARALAARGLDPDLPAMKAHGMPHLAALLRGEIACEEALERTQIDTRQYAKRQLTWMRGQMPGWARIETVGLCERMEAVVATLDGEKP